MKPVRPPSPHSAGSCAGRNGAIPRLCGQCGHSARTRARGALRQCGQARAHMRVRGNVPAQAARPHKRRGCAVAGTRVPAHLPAQATPSPHTRDRARAGGLLSLPFVKKSEVGRFDG